MDRVLIVDDDKTIARVVSRTLEARLSLPSTAVHSMSELQKLLEGEPTDSYWLGVLDYSLPDAPQGEVVDFMLSRGIPSIVLTGMYDPDIRERMLSKPIMDYIVKKSTRDLDHLATVIARAAQNRGQKALVVDDSAVYRDTMSSILRNQLLEVHVAKEGAEALKIIAKHPDMRLVITDYNMPGMDGLELLKNIRNTHKKDKLSVIMASGMAGQEIVPRFLKAGANDYIQKPFNVEEFICRVGLNLENMHLIETLKEYANRDPMTGLFNRRYLFDAGSMMHATARRGLKSLALYAFDIDHFKRINDTLGHAAGDMVIKRFASLLAHYFRRKNDIVARIGGEEFCAVSVFEDNDSVAEFAEEIRGAAQAEIVNYGGTPVQFTCSIGVCTEPLDSLEDMLRRADEMLYLAKNEGRNRVRVA